MKLTTLFSILFIGIFLFLPLAVLAGFTPLVPCGGPSQPSCELCHLFELFNNIVGFLLTRIVPILAVLMVVAGGGMFILSAGNPQTVNNAKSLIQAAIIGLILVYAAWFIVGLFLALIGLSPEWSGNFQSWWEQGLFQIDC